MGPLRMKYRAPVVHPEGNNVTADQCLSLHKKEKPPEIDHLADIRSLRYQPPVMHPGFTQEMRLDRVVVSDELQHRINTKPNIQDRIKTQKDLLRKEMMDAQIAKQKADLKAQWTKKVEEFEKQLADGTLQEDETNSMQEESKNDKGKENEGDSEDNKSKAADKKATENKEDAEESDFLLGDKKDDLTDEKAIDTTEFREQMLNMKEKKFLRLRQSHNYHKVWSKWQKRKMAVKLTYGLGDRDKNVTEVFPWLVIGRGEYASDMNLLMKWGITHVMNVTMEVENSHPHNFVYMRVPLRDDEKEDAGKRFENAANFIKRCEDCRGKIYVHCTAGASRAPTMVMAYLISHRDISLADSYRFIKALRPYINPNDHFLFQLAELEIAKGQGCSVYSMKEWDFYEFNLIRADGHPARDIEGVYATTMKLFDDIGNTDNMIQV